MRERNNDKENVESILQAHFNEKDKISKGKWPMKNKENFQNFCGKESQNSKNLTCQRGERRYNKHGGLGNFRGERKRFDKSKEQCYKCQWFNHFAKECNANKKESQEDEAKVEKDEFDEDITLLFMIMEENYRSKKMRDNICNSSKNVEKLSCGRLDDTIEQLREEEDAIMSMK